MKKILLSLFFLSALSFAASAQVEVKGNDKKVKVETPRHKKKIKKTSTPTQKVHNLVRPKHKKYSGVKVKRETKKDWRYRSGKKGLQTVFGRVMVYA